MCNCNENRRVITHATQRNNRGKVKVTYLLKAPLKYAGDYTGRTYVFKTKNSVQWVDERDAKYFQDNPSFEIEYGV